VGIFFVYRLVIKGKSNKLLKSRCSSLLTTGNQLLRIEEALGAAAPYNGLKEVKGQ